MTSTSQDWRALPVFLVFGLALSEYPFVLHALGVSGNPDPNPLGLLIAALIAAAVDKGWRGPAGILGSIVRVRVSPLFWLAAIALPILTIVVTLPLAAMQGIGIAIGVPAGLVFPAIPPERFADFWWIYAGVWAALAASIVLLTLGRLGTEDLDRTRVATI